MGTVQPVIEMQEIKEPKLVKFDKDGLETNGVLQSIDAIEMEDKDAAGKVIPGRPKKRAARFTLLEGQMDYPTGTFTPTGDRTCFLGTSQIVNALKTNHVGRYVIVRYEGEDRGVVKNGNAMKRFKIFVSNAQPKMDESISAANDLGISDADIPF